MPENKIKMKRLLLLIFVLAIISVPGYSSVNQLISMQTSVSFRAGSENNSYSVKPRKKKSGKPELRKPKQKPRHKREKGSNPVIF